MKGNALFLRILMILKFIAELIGVLAVGFVAVVLLAVGDFSKIPGLSVEGLNMTPEMLEKFRMPVAIIMGIGAVSLLLAMLSTLKVSKALKECGKRRPFSEESASALKSAGILELLSGIVSIGATVVATIYFKDLAEVNTATTASSGATVNLVFLANAAILFLLASVAKYGNDLGRQSSYSAINQMRDSSED